MTNSMGQEPSRWAHESWALQVHRQTWLPASKTTGLTAIHFTYDQHSSAGLTAVVSVKEWLVDGMHRNLCQALAQHETATGIAII